MSKGRLEEIEENAIVDKVYYKYTSETKDHWGKTYTLSQKDYDYLIKQAERVRELEELTHLQGEVILKQSDEIEIIDQQNVSYRKALKKLKRMVNDLDVDCGMICTEIREMELYK